MPVTFDRGCNRRCKQNRWERPMSQLGQTEKNSVRANIFRVTAESGHYLIQSACLKGAKSGSERTYSITSSA